MVNTILDTREPGKVQIWIKLVFSALILGVFTFVFVTPLHANSSCNRPSKRCILKEHRVLSTNDTLERIAQAYRVSVSDLKRWNDIDSNSLQRGRTLKLYYSPKAVRRRLTKHSGQISRPIRPRPLPQTAPTQTPQAEEGQSAFPMEPVYEGVASLMKPYPLKWILRGFGRCMNGKREHQAIDIAGVGPNFGLGTPVRAMALSKVVMIGRPEDNPQRYGVRDLRPGTVIRHGRALPRNEDVPGYGRVNYFTLDHGSARTGVVVVMKALEDGLENHTIRYMHLAKLHPSVQVGSVLKPGDEIGLMGSTAILTSVPHVHIDVTAPNGERLNVGRLLGLDLNYAKCTPGTEVAAHDH